MTPFDDEIAQGIAAGELCAKPLRHGDPCGRPIDPAYNLGMCEWHSEEALGLVHASDFAIAKLKHPCIDCGEREIAYRVTKRCARCHRNPYEPFEPVAQGTIIESSL